MGGGAVDISGCHNKIPHTGWFKQQCSFLIVLESGESKIKVLADLVLGKSPLSGLQMATFPLSAHMVFPQCVRVDRFCSHPLLIRPPIVLN